ncbi:type II toxin-antitoxin system RelE/ParE family toxin [Aurantibacillus circumpalustris]|uniref:type II toxin-antitoxin system RelE/ParE family toxin n=1 Tax=Aurantibacillus circumpalustris TaxID=3036359 RepID=UPI00295C24B7|nr:type II toxin-antitoxin system RelE/ParE family toxin [Aurantibacillus circumpalustris]
MLPVLIFDNAAKDFQKAYTYLEEQENGLGEKLLSRITEYIEVIETNPYIFKSGYRQIRQAKIKPFQHLLRYKVFQDYVAVIQLFHWKQNPIKNL